MVNGGTTIITISDFSHVYLKCFYTADLDLNIPRWDENEELSFKPRALQPKNKYVSEHEKLVPSWFSLT